MSVLKKRRPRFRIGDVVSFLYGPQRVSGEIIEDRGQLGEFGRRLYRVRFDFDHDDSMTIELPEEDMDDPARVPADGTAGIRQELNVTYLRRDRTNNWTATTTLGRSYKGVKAKGAVAYTIGSREGEAKGEENHGIVSVFMEADPRVANSNAPMLPDVWQIMAEEARQFADRIFRTRHPHAVIEHQDAVTE
jgi:hypothetical protein